MNSEVKPGAFQLDWRKVISRLAMIIGIGLLVSLAVPAIISGPVDLRSLLSFHVGFLLLAFSVGLIPLFMHAWTLFLWGRHFNKDLSGRDSVHIAATAAVGSAVTPTVLGGAPVKLGLLMLHRFRPGQAAAVASFGSLQDLLAFGAIIIASVSISKKAGPGVLIRKIRGIDPDFGSITLIILATLAVIGIGYLLLTRSRRGRSIVSAIAKSIGDFVTSYRMIGRHGKAVFFGTALITLGRWFFMYFVLIVLIMALPLPDPDFIEIWSLQWIVFTGMTVTPLPGGAGGAEAAFYAVYKPVIPEQFLVSLIIVWRFMTAYLRMIFAALLVIIFPLRAKPDTEEDGQVDASGQ